MLEKHSPDGLEMARRGVSSLTRREKEILMLLGGGETSKNIALNLHISPRTVEVHRSRILLKVGVRSTAMLIRTLADIEIEHMKARLSEQATGAGGPRQP